MERNLTKTQTRNDGTRTLFESVLAPEVIAAFKDWIAANPNSNGVLIGGLAVSYYAKPRFTQDVDILYPSENHIPKQVHGFKKTRNHAFVDLKRGIEIEVLSPTFLNISSDLAQKVLETAIMNDGVRIASPSGIVALKLGRLNAQDRADIIDMILHEKIDLTGFHLTQNQMSKYVALVTDSENEPPELKEELY